MSLYRLPISQSFMSDLRDKLQRPLRDLRISVTDRCNFRCPYCMPKEIFGPKYPFLSKNALLSDDELLRLIAVFAKGGVSKIRITGGEPLLREGLPEMIAQIEKIEGVDDISLTTNASLLTKQAKALANAGLHRVNVSLDSLSDDVFGRMNGREFPVSRVLEGIESALSEDLHVKVNMMVQKGENDSEILPMARFFKKRGITLRFIEYMDVGNSNKWTPEDVYPSKEIISIIHKENPVEPLQPNYKGEVASRYRYVGTETEIGIISSITSPFCGDCHRARLSADGKLFTCLFAQLGTDFRLALRRGDSDKDLFSLLSRIWGLRNDRYSEIRSEAIKEENQRKVEMSYIGG
jgi:cyclic pyranopterin phosphate synthase